MTLLIAAIADDFTGGLELASILARDGLRVRMLTRFAGPEDIAGLDATVIALKSRVAPAAEAIAAVYRAYATLEHGKPRQIFLKYCATFDSTDEGNIGPAADLLMERTGAPFTIFCPAFPAVGRTVFQGHLFAGSELISNSSKRLDPLTPMLEPDLVKVLARQTGRKVGLIRHEDLRRGREAIEARMAALQTAGVSYAISDGADDSDLERLAEVAVDLPLMTGGSTVVEHYGRHWRERGVLSAREPPPLPKARGHGAVLAGSCAERTFEQLATFGRQHPVLMLDPVDGLGAEEALALRALQWARPLMESGPFAIAVSSGPEEVARLQSRVGRIEAARLGERIMGRIALGLRVRGLRKLVVAGGETSGAVLEALGTRVLDVAPYEGPGISRAIETGPDPVAFCLKSGKLGPADMLEKVLRTL
jgi:uncharacterized protein YgbK (DUF1537 family)